MQTRNVGVNVAQPKNTCENDKKCPFHGSIPLRKRSYVAKVISCKMPKNAMVEWEWNRFLPKYERYEKRRTRIMVHNPACIDAKPGDTVRIFETRKLSKTKNFVIVEKIETKKAEKV